MLLYSNYCPYRCNLLMVLSAKVCSANVKLVGKKISINHCVSFLQIWGLKQQNFILSKFQRPDVQNQYIGRTMILFLVTPRISWHSWAYSSITLNSASFFTWATSLCVSIYPLFFSQGCRSLDVGPTLFQYDFILISYINKDPTSK